MTDLVAKRVFFSKLEDCKRKHGVQILRYKDVLKPECLCNGKNQVGNLTEWKILVEVEDFESNGAPSSIPSATR